MVTTETKYVKPIGRMDVKSLRLDGGTQSRSTSSQDVVNEYADKMRAGITFPPVIVMKDGNNFYLVDGFHRVMAAIQAGVSVLDAEIHQGSLVDAKWLSCGMNQAHGLQRTNDDKRKAVRIALQHPKTLTDRLSDRDIAEHCGVSQPFVSKLREELAATDNRYKSPERRGRDGRVRNVGKIGKSRRQSDRKVVPATPAKPEVPAVPQRHGLGTQHAYDAINCLKKILPNDPLRADGMQTVARWINDNGHIGIAVPVAAIRSAAAMIFEAAQPGGDRAGLMAAIAQLREALAGMVEVG